MIVHLVNKKYVPAKMTKEPTFEALAEILQGIFIVRYGSEIGTRDQAHNILAMAIIYQCGADGLPKQKQIEASTHRSWLTGLRS